MAKKLQSTTTADTDKNKGEEYNNLFTGERMWWPLESIKHISRELLEYCSSNQRCLTVEKFRIVKGIPRSTWSHWEAKHEFFKEANQEAQAILAMKRYEMAAFREVDKEVIFRDQYRLCKKTDEDDKRIHEMKKGEEASRDISINLYKAPDTGRKSQAQKEKEHEAKCGSPSNP